MHVVVFGHVNENYGGVQALLDFLPSRVEHVAAVLHPLRPVTGERASRFHAWRAGRKLEDRVVRRGAGPDTWEVFIDMILVLRWANRLGRRAHLVIGVNPLNALFGLALRKLGRAERVVFYAIDYTPRRYDSRLINKVYQRLLVFVAARTDFVWSVSNRIRAVWRDLVRLPDSRNLLVPIGIPSTALWAKRERPAALRSRLVFVGSLTREKGLQLALEALPHVAATHPEVHLTVVGSGPYEADLHRLAQTLHLGDDKVTWLGHLEHDRVPDVLASCGIAIAPYTEDDGSVARYADVTKPKEYLACGLPVVVTRVPEIAETIERMTLGLAVGYSKEELAQALKRLISDAGLYAECTRNVSRYVQHISWDSVFERAFQEMTANVMTASDVNTWGEIMLPRSTTAPKPENRE